MPTRTPNIDLVLQQWPAADPCLRANIHVLGLTTKQYEKEMSIMASTIRANQIKLALKVLIIMGIVDYAASWSASAFLKMSRAMKLDSFKARMAMEMCQVKLAKEAALVALLDIGAVAIVDKLNNVRESFLAQIETKRKELAELDDSMNAEIKRVTRFYLPVTNYRPPSKGELNRQCVDIENKRRFDQGMPEMTKNDYKLEMTYEFHHPVVLQYHKEEYVRDIQVQEQLQEFAKYKIQLFCETSRMKLESLLSWQQRAWMCLKGLPADLRWMEQDSEQRNGDADNDGFGQTDAEVLSPRALPKRKRSLDKAQRSKSPKPQTPG